jgi:hypothetical protein
MEAAVDMQKPDPPVDYNALLSDPARKDEVRGRLAAIHPLVDVKEVREGFVAFGRELEETVRLGGIQAGARAATDHQLGNDEIPQRERARTELVNGFVIDAYLEKEGRMKIGAPNYAHPLDIGAIVQTFNLPRERRGQGRMVGVLHDIKEDTERKVEDICSLAVTMYPFPTRKQNKDFLVTIPKSVDRLTRSGFFYVSEYRGIVREHTREHRADDMRDLEDRLICGEVKSADRAQLNPLIIAFPDFWKRFKESIKSYWVGAAIMKPLLESIPLDHSFRQSVQNATYHLFFTLLGTLDEFIEEKETELRERGEEKIVAKVRESVQEYVAEGGLLQVSQPAERTFLMREGRKNDGTLIGGFLLLFPERDELERRMKAQYLDLKADRNALLKDLIKGDMRFMTSDAYRKGRRPSTEEFERLMDYRDRFVETHQDDSALQLRRYLLLRDVVMLEVLDPNYKIIPTM